MSALFDSGEIGKSINQILDLNGTEDARIVKVETCLDRTDQVCFCTAPIRNLTHVKNLKNDWTLKLHLIQHLFPQGYELSIVDKPTRLIAASQHATKALVGVYVQRCTNASVLQIVAKYRKPISTPPIAVRNSSKAQQSYQKTKKSAQAPLPRSMIL